MTRPAISRRIFRRRKRLRRLHVRASVDARTSVEWEAARALRRAARSRRRLARADPLVTDQQPERSIFRGRS